MANCKLSKINDELVKFKAGDNAFEANKLNADAPGTLYILTSTNAKGVAKPHEGRHDIFVAGEHIAGGFGFDDADILSAVNSVFVDDAESDTYLAPTVHAERLHDIIHKYDDIIAAAASAKTTLPPSDDVTTDEPGDDVPANIDYTHVDITNVKIKYMVKAQRDAAFHEVDNLDAVEVGSRVALYNIKFNISGTQAQTDFNSRDLFAQIRNAAGTVYLNASAIYDYLDINFVDGYGVGEVSLTDPAIYESVCFIYEKEAKDQFVLYIKDTAGTYDSTLSDSNYIYWVYPWFSGNIKLIEDEFKSYNGKYYIDIDKTIVGKRFTIEHSSNPTYGYVFLPKSWAYDGDTLKDFNIILSQSNITGVWGEDPNLTFTYKGYGNQFIDYICLKSLNKYTGSTTWEVKNYI